VLLPATYSPRFSDCCGCEETLDDTAKSADETSVQRLLLEEESGGAKGLDPSAFRNVIHSLKTSAAKKIIVANTPWRADAITEDS
jgi:hypothetical protein